MIKLSVPEPMDWPEFREALLRAPCGERAIYAHVAKRMNLHAQQIGALASIAPEDRALVLAEVYALPAPEPDDPTKFQGQGSLTSIDDGLPSAHAYNHPDVPTNQRREIEVRRAEVKREERRIFGGKSVLGPDWD